MKCGWVEVNYPVDTAGNRRIWKCYCDTTACQHSQEVFFQDLILDEQISKESEKEFYKEVFKTKI